MQHKLRNSFKKIKAKCYEDHPNSFYVYAKPNNCDSKTVPAITFIERLIQHIPEKHFKMIRYGGLYARHRGIDKKLHRAISREKHHIYRSFNRWRQAISLSFGYDPLKCPDCGSTMSVLELYYNHKRVSLEETYEKAMSKVRNKYIKNPPEGMTPRDIRQMSESDLLDMDYFLHEFDDDDDDWGTEGFYIF